MVWYLVKLRDKFTFIFIGYMIYFDSELILKHQTILIWAINPSDAPFLQRVTQHMKTWTYIHNQPRFQPVIPVFEQSKTVHTLLRFITFIWNISPPPPPPPPPPSIQEVRLLLTHSSISFTEVSLKVVLGSLVHVVRIV